MSRKFHAEHRETGERWKSESSTRQYLVMYDSGFLAVVTEDYYTYINPLDNNVWRKVIH